MAQNINDLRNVLRRRHKAVTRKISRMRVQTGVEITGTGYDPRASLDNVDTMNRKQLNYQIGRLNVFMDRKTQFVPDAHGKPIHSADFKVYESAQKRRNAAVQTYYSKFKDVFIPMANMTVDQRMKLREAQHPHMQNSTVNSPYKTIHKGSTSLDSAKALVKATKMAEKYSDPKQFEKNIRSARRIARDVLKTIGEKELQVHLNKLSNDQFALIWNYTPFPDNIFLPYEMIGGLTSAKKTKAKYNSQALINELDEALEYAKWAKGVKFSS